jgi:predicted RNase H-like HicB family nuclease
MLDSFPARGMRPDHGGTLSLERSWPWPIPAPQSGRTMLTEYVCTAMRKAKYEMLDDGTFFGDIPECQSVWANEDTLEARREELRSALEDWLLLGVYLHHEIPVLDGIDLNVRLTAEEEVVA